MAPGSPLRAASRASAPAEGGSNREAVARAAYNCSKTGGIDVSGARSLAAKNNSAAARTASSYACRSATSWLRYQ
ncbi:hypothetical protein D3C59_25885 [Streptomyces sp. SHP22-7]|nr:hypothetical protein D3C59_25885 [Streptomyces sp. SHP22-7]